MMLAPLLVALLATAAPTASPIPAPPAATPVAQELWRGAKVGMAAKAVQDLFPQGHAPYGEGRNYALPAQDDGAQPIWQMDEQVYGRPAVATFFAKNGGLTSVILKLTGLKAHATLGNMGDARALKTAFSGYYGAPRQCFDSTARGLDQIACTWEGHGLRIGLSYQDFAGSSPFMIISIRPIPAPHKPPPVIFGRRNRRD
jgi:hypothetical protein